MKKKTWLKRILWTYAAAVVLANVLAGVHAWKFTHFSDHNEEKSSMEVGFWSKVGMAFTGVSNPRPGNPDPELPCKRFTIKSNVLLECWEIENDSSVGTVIVFHGYGGNKASMQDKAVEFHNMGYRVLLVDFMGSGGSEGNTTTIGYDEAEEVKSCFDYVKEQGESNIVLFGTSMGAVAIMKAVNDHAIVPSSVILECPFGSLYKTVCNRFDMMGVPSFPMAGLMTFWGGIENGFWAFDHEPVEYAKNIHCMTLILYGERDPKVSREEIDAIYNNIPGQKQLVTFADAGHENYLTQYRDEWQLSVKQFLGAH